MTSSLHHIHSNWSYRLRYGEFLIDFPGFADLHGARILSSRNTGYIKNRNPRTVTASGVSRGGFSSQLSCIPRDLYKL
ncbi:hypothetical protein N7489_004938 [Penicillium chrysogenum]|uniref:Uncharacterized protein n=1 Tax=Penicillium chrysogenum TaxID=5076 RepID=A0ABQ8WDV4_PENCH|nr:uncharacterized protein N7489_004938 [Penicillium chrysogenum]KAJ5244842.1 hypothetical protein N7489_004938 [Penicillium chrysogenum]KAJ5264822.1 hypothetical protein N7505_007615 [Penicillium chrysogenum]KAJ5849288.1 hypothetical protein N7534_007977 [Penicillium rubens]